MKGGEGPHSPQERNAWWEILYDAAEKLLQGVLIRTMYSILDFLKCYVLVTNSKSELSKMCVCVCVHIRIQSHSHVWVFVTPWTVAPQAPLSMKFSRQEYWCGLPFPSPGDLPDPGIKPGSPVSPVLAGGFFILLSHWGCHQQMIVYKMKVHKITKSTFISLTIHS